MLSGMMFLTGLGMVVAGKSMEAADRRRYEQEKLAEKARRESHNFCPDHMVDALCNNMRSNNGYGINTFEVACTVDWSRVSLPQRAEQCLVAEFFIEMLTNYELDWDRQTWVPYWMASWKREHNMMDFLAKDYFVAINTKFVYNPDGFFDLYKQWDAYKDKLSSYTMPFYILGLKPPIDILKLRKEINLIDYGSRGQRVLTPEIKEKCREEYVALEYKWW